MASDIFGRSCGVNVGDMLDFRRSSTVPNTQRTRTWLSISLSKCGRNWKFHAADSYDSPVSNVSSGPNLKAHAMTPTKYVERPIPTISLKKFDDRIDAITKELVDAAENVGFFCVVDHGISRESVDRIFDQSARFFGQDDDVKAQVPFSPQHNAGWEKNSQVRPSTGVADRKESYQTQFGEGMDGKHRSTLTSQYIADQPQGRWLADKTLLGFRQEALGFMRQAQDVSEKLMTCFARGLGFEDDYFVKAHDVSRPESQTVCRLLHYFETPELPNPTGEVYHRAGAHADWDLLTLLFQKVGQSGLEICPDRELSTSFGYGDAWTKVEPDAERNAIGEFHGSHGEIFY